MGLSNISTGPRGIDKVRPIQLQKTGIAELAWDSIVYDGEAGFLAKYPGSRPPRNRETRPRRIAWPRRLRSCFVEIKGHTLTVIREPRRRGKMEAFSAAMKEMALHRFPHDGEWAEVGYPTHGADKRLTWGGCVNCVMLVGGGSPGLSLRYVRLLAFAANFLEIGRGAFFWRRRDIAIWRIYGRSPRDLASIDSRRVYDPQCCAYTRFSEFDANDCALGGLSQLGAMVVFTMAVQDWPRSF